MEKDRVNRLAVILNDHENEILEDWLKLQRTASTRRPDPISDAELRAQCHEFLATFRRSVDSAGGGATYLRSTGIRFAEFLRKSQELMRARAFRHRKPPPSFFR
jgi:hypothetical protein